MSASDHLSDQQFGGYRHSEVRQVPVHEVRSWMSGDFPDLHALSGLSALSDHTRSSYYTPEEAHRFNQRVATDRAVHSPLVASYDYNMGRNELWDGHHRYWAARRAGLSHVPVKWDLEHGNDDPRYHQ